MRERKRHRATSLWLGALVAVLAFASVLAFTVGADARPGHSTDPNVAADVGNTWCGRSCQLLSVRDAQTDGHCVFLTKHGRYVPRSKSCGSTRWVVVSSTSGVEVCITGHWRCEPVKFD